MMNAESFWERQGVGFVRGNLAQKRSTRINVSQITPIGRDRSEVNRRVRRIGRQPNFLGKNRLQRAGGPHSHVEAEAERKQNNHQSSSYQPPPRFRCAGDSGIWRYGALAWRSFHGRKFHRSEEAISAARQRFHKAGILCRVAQRIAQPLDRGVQAVVEVHERIGGPQAAVEILPGDHFAGTLQQHGQDLKGLLLQANLEAVAAELPGAQVYVKDSKADNSVCGFTWHLAHLDRAP